MRSQGPLIVQSDHTLMLEVEHPQYTECRDFLALFAELVKSPEFIHSYRVTPLSLWNAAALEMSLEEIIAGLERPTSGLVRVAGRSRGAPERYLP